MAAIKAVASLNWRDEYARSRHDSELYFFREYIEANVNVCQ
jgi:hypothetical protein